MQYHAQNRRREKLPIKGLPSLEKEMVRRIKPILLDQTDDIITDDLVQKAAALWRSATREM